MPLERARNPWSIILHHEEDRVLELRWLPATSAMTDGGFKATLALFVWEAERVRPPYLLIDALQFNHEFGEGVMRWRDDHIIPRYGAAGTCKLAFLVPDGFPATVEAGGKAEPEGDAIFPTAWFCVRDNALAWFRQD
jgi:hypothetical protein